MNVASGPRTQSRRQWQTLLAATQVALNPLSLSFSSYLYHLSIFLHSSHPTLPFYQHLISNLSLVICLCLSPPCLSCLCQPPLFHIHRPPSVLPSSSSFSFSGAFHLLLITSFNFILFFITCIVSCVTHWRSAIGYRMSDI